jgi:hypothetical protein
MLNCDICHKEVQIPVCLSCNHSFCFLCASPDKIDDMINGVCLVCDSNGNTSPNNCELIENDKKIDYNSSNNYVWLYSSNYGNTWWCYKREHCEKVELIYVDHCLKKQILNGNNNPSNINLKIVKKTSNNKLQSIPSIVSFNTLYGSDDESDTDTVDFSSDYDSNSPPSTNLPVIPVIQSLSYIVNIYGGDYKLDFEDMKQFNVNDPTKKRTVMRLQILEKTYFSSAKDIRLYLSNNNIIGVSGKKFH